MKPSPQISSTTTIGHYENFPVASLLCPAHLRPPIAALYHFARTADDIADEGDATPARRLAQLSDYRAQLHLACQPQSPDGAEWDPRWAPQMQALRQTLARWPLEPALLHDLLDAFEQDVRKTYEASDYATHAELLDYCRRSANPVGRLLLALYGVSSPQALAQSDAICTALQLINFLQDARIDLARGRNYFPRELQDRFGVRPDHLRNPPTQKTVRGMVAHCVQQARSTMLQGAPLVHHIGGRAGWELRLVVQGGLRILEKIEALGFDTLRQRPRLHASDYPTMLWRALWM
ncbi:squalene synthase HpnC [Rhodoferax sp.]|jgi:squalene synthase HpnC|uniref:squalene synthase HpnC n=1 Tax=Rhodoferax sp. TaxID=50421 RepID=UPI003784661E